MPGKLIEEAGLRRLPVWAARRCPEKHCGFVINRDHATASDIAALCRDGAEAACMSSSGVELETEVKTLGFYDIIYTAYGKGRNFLRDL